jgi:hypothetical protein
VAEIKGLRLKARAADNVSAIGNTSARGALISVGKSAVDLASLGPLSFESFKKFAKVGKSKSANWK